eukprot:TRINITY_DN786_c0_g1_i1.p1 TRINITY_DN786_c0_g1~~TRINITY_DN786_c0_g1_i1.p1  ORF type:complete len:201 (+),score=11.14 TRINITY_DN786_c0_g1_i1:1129-1731(+)
MDDPFDYHTRQTLSRPQRIAINFLDITNLTLVDIIIQTAMWVGWWNLLAYWVWPWNVNHYVARDIVYFLMGALLKFIGVVWLPEEDLPHVVAAEWKNGMPESYGWGRKLYCYSVRSLHFFAFLFMWAGAWNFFDVYLHNCGYCWEREIWYITIPAILLFFTQEVLSRESLYWIFARYNGWRARSNFKNATTPLYAEPSAS